MSNRNRYIMQREAPADALILHGPFFTGLSLRPFLLGPVKCQILDFCLGISSVATSNRLGTTVHLWYHTHTRTHSHTHTHTHTYTYTHISQVPKPGKYDLVVLDPTNLPCATALTKYYFFAPQLLAQPFLRVTWLIWTCNWLPSLDQAFPPWTSRVPLFMCHMTDLNLWHDLFLCVTHRISMCDMTHTQSFCVPLIVRCVAWRIHVFEMTDSCV